MKLRHLTLVGYAGGLALGIGVVMTYGAMEMSGAPAFCGSCHVMGPYYESWKTSSHAEIACVDCHIPPGVTATFRKKFEALSMVASYVTGTYGTNPWAEVDDESCLQCHERRLLGGQEMYGSILFDHSPHLAELRRGKRLRCTSCHSQIVQGSHITVTASTCILCHFKDQVPNEGTAECALCHQTPQEIVDADGVQFDHGDVERFGMDCQSCHVSPRGAGGRVSRDRCMVCHNQPSRLDKLGETDHLHQTHVTDHKGECASCHSEIEHILPRHLEAAQTGCASCHQRGHSPQRNLYAGLGGKGVEPQPDVMYRSQVRCEGCHFEHADGSKVSGEVACMSCHGPEFRKIYHLWSDTLEERTAAFRRNLSATERRLGREPPEAFEYARANLELVERGKGIHNFPYSLALLDAAHGQLNEARSASGLGELRTPWATAPFTSACLNCHAGVESARVRVFGTNFSHRPHVVGQGMDCLRCHTTHEDRDQGAAALTLTAADCGSCHHGEAARGRQCLDCHSGVLDRTFATELGDFPHSFHVVDMEQACGDCHGEAPRISAEADREFCSDCH